MTSQPNVVTIQVLLNILGSKGNQKLKFDKLIEYNNRSIFLQKLHRK